MIEDSEDKQASQKQGLERNLHRKDNIFRKMHLRKDLYNELYIEDYFIN